MKYAEQEKLTREDLEDWLSTSWKMYACNTAQRRRGHTKPVHAKLDVSMDGVYRVSVKREVIYEGDDMDTALDAYNDDW